MNNRFGLLGICIDPIKKEDLTKTLAELHKDFKKHSIPKYGTTINALFFSSLYGWTLASEANKELLKIIRKADFVGLDASYLCHLGKFFGCSNMIPISGEFLFKEACEFLEENNLSLYVLGGNEETNRALHGYLRIYYPKIRQVGSATPLILTKGERLEESQERDHFIVEAINQAKPDILFLQLGHPKQEIWFERVKSRLKVPITLGMGGAIERYFISVSSQEKITNQDRLIKTTTKLVKHLPDYLKYAFWLLPLSLYTAVNHTLAKIFSFDKSPEHRSFFLSSNKSLIVIPFPNIVTGDHPIAQWLEEAIEQDYIVLDFGKLKHIDSQGIAQVAETVKWAENLGKKIFIMNVHPDVRYLLKLNGFWNYFQVFEARNPQEIIYRMSEAGKGPLNYLEFYESIYQEKNEVVLSFFGEISFEEDYEQLVQKLMPILHQKSCLVNLTYCTFIDNKGIGFLLKLKNLQKANGNSFKIAGINATIAKQLKIAKVYSVLNDSA